MSFKRLIKAGAFGVMLFVLFLGPSVSVRGQHVGIFRAPQGRRVGRVRLPTPPFNPDAGILESRSGRAHRSPKTRTRRPAAHGIKATNRNPHPRTPRRRRMRRGRKISVTN